MTRGCFGFILSMAGVAGVYVLTANKRFSFLEFLILVFALLGGLSLLAVFSALMLKSESLDRADELESAHHNISQAETNERLSLAWKAKAAGFGTPEAEAIHVRLAELERQHKEKWNARVKEISDIRFPVSDEEYAELDAEIERRKQRRRR